MNAHCAIWAKWIRNHSELWDAVQKSTHATNSPGLFLQPFLNEHDWEQRNQIGNQEGTTWVWEDKAAHNPDFWTHMEIRRNFSQVMYQSGIMSFQHQMNFYLLLLQDSANAHFLENSDAEYTTRHLW